MTGFQKVVNRDPAPAVAGDFASNNPRTSVIPAVAGGLVVAAGQAVTVGWFAWAGADGKVYSSAAAAGAGAVLGFVARQPNIPSVLITAFLAESKMTLNDGMPCTLQSSGDYWADLPGADPGEVIYVDPATGQPNVVDGGSFAVSGFAAASQALVNVVTAATTTIAVNTGIMTVATVASGGNNIQAGDSVTGTGVPAGTIVERQLTGTAGGAGTYQTNNYNRAAVAAFAATFHQGTLAIISKQGA